MVMILLLLLLLLWLRRSDITLRSQCSTRADRPGFVLGMREEDDI